MSREIPMEDKDRLIAIYQSIKNDFEKFPYIKRVEDFFIWRSKVKEEIRVSVIGTEMENNEDYIKKARNSYIENAIKDNESLMLLYDWSKFYRIIDNTKANVRNLNYEYGLDENNDIIKASIILQNYLMENKKTHVDDVFNILHLTEINLGINYPLEGQRTISTSYELARAFVKEEETESWPAILFVTLLKTYGITGEDLLTVARITENIGNEYIKNITSQVSDDVVTHKKG